MLLQKGEEVFLGEFIFLFVEVIFSKQEVCILFCETSNIGFDLWIFSAFLEAFDSQDAAFSDCFFLGNMTVFTALLVEDTDILHKQIPSFIFFSIDIDTAEDLTSCYVLRCLFLLLLIILRLRLFLDNVFLLELSVLRPEVVTQVVFSNVLKKRLLKQHLIKLLDWIAEKLNKGVLTILSNSEKLTPPDFLRS